MHVERVRRERTDGGIYLPQAFDHGSRPSLKMGAIADHFEAKVLAVGPEVALVWTYADGDGSELFTGEGDRERLLVRCPDDIVCALVAAAAL